MMGWSQADLARRIGFAPETISRYRTGQKEPTKVVTEYLRLALFIHEKGYRVP